MALRGCQDSWRNPFDTTGAGVCYLPMPFGPELPRSKINPKHLAEHQSAASGLRPEKKLRTIFLQALTLAF